MDDKPDLMTPRDEFANSALRALLSVSLPKTEEEVADVTAASYEFADAMLSARGEGKVCEWKNCGEYWTTGCHNGTSKHQSDMHYCPYCGKKIKEVENG